MENDFYICSVLEMTLILLALTAMENKKPSIWNVYKNIKYEFENVPGRIGSIAWKTIVYYGFGNAKIVHIGRSHSKAKKFIDGIA